MRELSTVGQASSAHREIQSWLRYRSHSQLRKLSLSAEELLVVPAEFVAAGTERARDADRLFGARSSRCRLLGGSLLLRRGLLSHEQWSSRRIPRRSHGEDGRQSHENERRELHGFE